ncbi:MAG: Antilisterial bacteriocin subtilosin biosynthesis protein AlbA [Syntrophorhabdaceae bacterium PtaU1.Bin034]|nr:MAG: Antilisterial bacteriocin subtilosin biosynthesis protein AlbA [Syntrophorhabdaceae bacterium PtaU1.Bin034]
MNLERLRNKLLFFRQTFTGRRLFNLALQTVQVALGHSRLCYYPSRLTIDIGNICNLRCPLCPTGRGDRSASRGFMKIEDYRKVIDTLAPFLTHLELHNWGEPLLHRDLVAMISYAKDRRIPVSISTNLTVLEEGLAEDLMASRLEKVFISCDGASPETYAAYRRGGDFRLLITNIRRLLEAKKELKNNYTRLKLLFHVFRHNQHEVAKIEDLARELGVELFIDRMRTDMAREILETARTSIERDGEWIPTDPRFCPFDMEKNEKAKETACRDLWTTSVINWDGKVFPCCSVYGDEHSFGNVLQRPFAAIWNNDEYISARKEVLNKVEKSPTICHTCKANGFRHL